MIPEAAPPSISAAALSPRGVAKRPPVAQNSGGEFVCVAAEPRAPARGMTMRIVAFILLALGLAAGGALAASPEDEYVAARDKDIARIKRLVTANADDAKVQAEQDKMRADLEKRLGAILGPFAIAGYPSAGKISLETLSDSEIGFGMLDGLVHTAGDNGPQVVVTTRTLLERWLRVLPTAKDPGERLPADVDAALRLDRFYSFAIASDSAFGKTADLAVTKPKGADLVVAELGGFAQDIGPNSDQQILVTLQKDGRIYIATQSAKSPIGKIEACEAIWSAADEKTQEMKKAYQKSGAKDEKLFDASNKLEDQGDQDYRACLVARTPQEAYYPALAKEAQELADRLAAP